MAAVDPHLPYLFDRAQVRERGLSDRQVDGRLASGRWRAERRGIYRVADADTGLPYEVLAALRTIAPGSTVASHASAARWWGLPRPLGGWGAVTLTAASGFARNRRGVNVRIAPLPDAHVLVRGPYAVTTPARTVADCLRVLPPVDALAVADAALHRGLTTPELVAEMVEFQSGWPGCRQARAVLPLLEARRESPLESWSAWTFHLLGLPRPDWQVVLTTPAGWEVARVDAWWPQGVAGEADGRSKYALAAAERGGADATTLAGVLDAERAREQQIRDLDAEVVRWGATDVLNPRRHANLRARIARHLGREPMFTGRAISSPAPPPRPPAL